MGVIRKGTKTFRQINLAFFAAGFVTFITLYDVQPLLPLFFREYGVPAALGSLPLSVATCALAVAMLFAGSLSETVGRKPLISSPVSSFRIGRSNPAAKVMKSPQPMRDFIEPFLPVLKKS